jgi:type IV pilus assembly protein PilC
VVGAAVITVVIMLLAVVPTFATVYKDLKADLPWATKTLIGLSNVVVQWWYVVAIVSGIGFFAYKKYAATPGGRQRIDSLSLKFPILGPLFRKIAIARFTQSLAGATRAGVPVLKALQISANTSGNVIIRDAVLNVAVAVRDGSAIGTELTKTGHFPAMVTRMISAGEASGDLDSMLEEINRFYERDVAYAVEKLTKMIEPLMTGVVGGIVLMVLMALYMPIFSLGKAFQNSGSK